jgi:CRP-like cAMP-binding protein
MSIAEKILEGLAGEPLPEWDVAEAATKSLNFAPGASLFWTGDRHPFIYFVCMGLIKLVYDTPDGNEWVKAFCAEESFFASASALSAEGRTSFSAVCVEATVVERLDFSVIRRLADIHIGWQRACSNAFQLYGVRKEKRERELLTLSAEERYRLFVKEHPALWGRIPQKDLARYLGVTPVGLSRIKSRVQCVGSE